MAFELFDFCFMVVTLFIIGVGIASVKALIKQTKEWKNEDALPLLVVEATLVEKRSVRRSGTTTHYATFEFENGNRHEFWIEWVEYLSLVEGCVGQLSIQGTRYKKFEKIG